MYTVLVNEVADVDKGLFHQLGHFVHGVKALPVTNQVFAVKSVRSHEIDSELNCQNSLFVTADVDVDSTEWMQPGALYENNGKYFVELRYDHSLGLVKLTMYFLVPICECEFYLQYEDGWELTTFDKLQELGNYLWVAQ